MFSDLPFDHALTTNILLLYLPGVYGDVIRVKILYNKKDNALLQYNEPTQAQLGMHHNLSCLGLKVKMHVPALLYHLV